MKIWILKISSPNDEKITVYENRDDAFIALADYVETEWDDGMIDQFGEFINLTKDDAVDLYFETLDSALDPEYYDIEETEFVTRTVYPGSGESEQERTLSEMGLVELFETASKQLGFEESDPPGKEALNNIRAVFTELSKRFPPHQPCLF